MAIDFPALRDRFPITEVLARMGITIPNTARPGSAGATEQASARFRVAAAALGLGHGPDDSQGVLIKPETPERSWWAFHDERGGDVVELVRAASGVGLREAVALLETTNSVGRPAPIPVNRDPAAHAGQDGRYAARSAFYEEPDLSRTPVERVRAINAEAWRYYTLPKLAERAKAYLVGRGVDADGLTALEEQTGAPMAGHTTRSATGLVDHLTKKGFTVEEMVDAGWAAHRLPTAPTDRDEAVTEVTGRVVDRFRDRVLIPFKTETGEVLGVTGRNVNPDAGDRTPKYLNHPKTVLFDKSEVLYRPTEHQVSARGGAVVVEGTLDALAIAAAAARAGVSEHFAPCSQSGVSLTAQVADRVAAISPRPPIVCGDPDPAGISATARWARSTMTGLHREVLTVTLPQGTDPLDWLAGQGTIGLLAFSSYGCLDDVDHLRPTPAGGVLARQEFTAALDRAAKTVGRDLEPHELHQVLPPVLGRLRELAAAVPDREAGRRFAAAAAGELVQHVDGHPAGWYADQIAGQISSESISAPAKPPPVSGAVRQPQRPVEAARRREFAGYDGPAAAVAPSPVVQL